jgi:NAD(P)-dependent dehydrogenase (short-subunit alcohol dehydrogenase family)
MGVIGAETIDPVRGQGNAARVHARTIGLLYVVIAVLAAFAEVFVRGGMLVPGNAARTAANILANEEMYRAAGAADVIVLTCDVAVAVLFYALLKHVNRTVALLAAAFRLSLVAVNGAAILTHFAPLMMLRENGALSAINTGELQAFSVLALELHSVAFSIAIVFFGVHCILIGYLFYRSGFVPRLFGVLWIIAGAFYVIHSMLSFLAVQLPGSLADIILLVAGISELSVVPWLLITGVNPDKWKARTAATALGRPNNPEVVNVCFPPIADTRSAHGLTFCRRLNEKRGPVSQPARLRWKVSQAY